LRVLDALAATDLTTATDIGRKELRVEEVKAYDNLRRTRHTLLSDTFDTDYCILSWLYSYYRRT
jgi:hypothetical protein